MKNLEIEEGDILEVLGSHVAIGEAQVVFAREVRRGADAWTVRDATGRRPSWAGGHTAHMDNT